MRAWILSDLHLEFCTSNPAFQIPEADVCICAGDVLDKGLEASILYLGMSLSPHMPVVFVPGNHEFYGSSIIEGRKRGLELASAYPDLHVLDRDVVSLGGYRFIGAMLWSDFGLFEDRRMAMLEAEKGLNDYRKIKMSKKPFKRFSARHALGLHIEDRLFLKGTLDTPCDEPTIVVTHHAPSILSVLPEYMDDPLTPSFVSNLEREIIRNQPRLWVHGHLHNRSDYYIQNTRVICNPRGYPDEAVNSGFDPLLVIDLNECRGG